MTTDSLEHVSRSKLVSCFDCGSRFRTGPLISRGRISLYPKTCSKCVDRSRSFRNSKTTTATSQTLTAVVTSEPFEEAIKSNGVVNSDSKTVINSKTTTTIVTTSAEITRTSNTQNTNLLNSQNSHKTTDSFHMINDGDLEEVNNDESKTLDAKNSTIISNKVVAKTDNSIKHNNTNNSSHTTNKVPVKNSNKISNTIRRRTRILKPVSYKEPTMLEIMSKRLEKRKINWKRCEGCNKTLDESKEFPKTKTGEYETICSKCFDSKSLDNKKVIKLDGSKGEELTSKSEELIVEKSIDLENQNSKIKEPVESPIVGNKSNNTVKELVSVAKSGYKSLSVPKTLIQTPTNSTKNSIEKRIKEPNVEIIKELKEDIIKESIDSSEPIQTRRASKRRINDETEPEIVPRRSSRNVAKISYKRPTKEQEMEKRLFKKKKYPWKRCISCFKSFQLNEFPQITNTEEFGDICNKCCKPNIESKEIILKKQIEKKKKPKREFIKLKEVIIDIKPEIKSSIITRNRSKRERIPSLKSRLESSNSINYNNNNNNNNHVEKPKRKKKNYKLNKRLTRNELKELEKFKQWDEIIKQWKKKINGSKSFYLFNKFRIPFLIDNEQQQEEEEEDDDELKEKDKRNGMITYGDYKKVLNSMQSVLRSRGINQEIKTGIKSIIEIPGFKEIDIFCNRKLIKNLVDSWILKQLYKIIGIEFKILKSEFTGYYYLFELNSNYGELFVNVVLNIVQKTLSAKLSIKTLS